MTRLSIRLTVVILLLVAGSGPIAAQSAEDRNVRAVIRVRKIIATEQGTGVAE